MGNVWVSVSRTYPAFWVRPLLLGVENFSTIWGEIYLEMVEDLFVESNSWYVDVLRGEFEDFWGQ